MCLAQVHEALCVVAAPSFMPCVPKVELSLPAKLALSTAKSWAWLELSPAGRLARALHCYLMCAAFALSRLTKKHCMRLFSSSFFYFGTGPSSGLNNSAVKSHCSSQESNLWTCSQRATATSITQPFVSIQFNTILLLAANMIASRINGIQTAPSIFWRPSASAIFQSNSLRHPELTISVCQKYTAFNDLFCACLIANNCARCQKNIPVPFSL